MYSAFGLLLGRFWILFPLTVFCCRSRLYMVGRSVHNAATGQRRRHGRGPVRCISFLLFQYFFPHSSSSSFPFSRQAESALKSALQKHRGNISINEGDGAFYAPKIDFYISDALGRKHQTATIQLDFVLPRRFGLAYTDATQQQVQPVIIHRAICGSLERMLAILIEHTGGRWPFWLSPRQVGGTRRRAGM